MMYFNEKSIDKINYDRLVNIEIIDAIRYYYFGKTYHIVNSEFSLKKINSLKKKIVLLQEVLHELDEDLILKTPELKYVKEAIRGIILNKIGDVNHSLNEMNDKPHYGLFRFNILQR